MDVGFTGTQVGMKARQKEGVKKVLLTLKADTARHGMCIGADKEFHDICRELKDLYIYIWGYPGVDDYGNSPKRAECDVNNLIGPYPYLARNRMIVNDCEIMIAAPKTYEEERRSGTWATIRRAREVKKTCFIVYPNGDISV